MNLVKQNVEQADSVVQENNKAIGLLADYFNAPIKVIKSLFVNPENFLNYMETLYNPWNVPLTLKQCINLFNNGYDNF